jgi:hypothetical protein
MEVYDDWYQNRKIGDEIESISGFFGREHTHVLKLSMIFSLSSMGNPMVIGSDHMSAAMDAIRDVKETMSLALKGAGAEDNVKHISLVINEMKKIGIPITRKELGKRLWRYMGIQKLDEALDSLLQIGKIVTHQPDKNRAPYFIIM